MDISVTFTLEPPARNEPTIVKVAGSLDLSTQEKLVDSLTEAAALAPHGEVLIDAKDVTFIDCAGLKALEQAVRVAAREGCNLMLDSCSEPVGRILRLTGESPRALDTVHHLPDAGHAIFEQP